MTDGSEMAFAHTYQPVMDLVKESLALSFSQSQGSIRERLLQASIVLEAAMAKRFPSSEEFGENQYVATFIATVISGNQIFSAWIGSQQAKLFRGSCCVKATVPHIFVAPGTGNKIALTTKCLSTVSGGPREQVDIEGPWNLCVGDVLVIADYCLFALGTDDEITSILSRAPDSAARSLVEWAERVQHQFAQSAIVIRAEW
ncbi:MAG TPA: hypothetical protein VH575_34480 [Gemmataceae bacterium]|jgi:hypothetical protein